MWAPEKQVHGRLYTTRFSVGNEKDALAELALFRRDPPAYVDVHLLLWCPQP